MCILYLRRKHLDNAVPRSPGPSLGSLALKRLKKNNKKNQHFKQNKPLLKPLMCSIHISVPSVIKHNQLLGQQLLNMWDNQTKTPI